MKKICLIIGAIAILCLALNVNAGLVTDGLISRWSFDAQSTPAKDDYGNSDGTISGVVTWTNDTYGTVSLGALYFDDTVASNYINCGTDESLNVFRTAGSKQLTISVWIKRASIGSQDYIVSNGSSYFLRINAADTIYFTALGVKDYYFTQTIKDTGVWHNIVIVYDANYDVSLYLDGVFKEKVTHTAVARTSSTAFLISSNIGKFNGTIDEICIYNLPLSAAQVLQNYQFMLPSVGTQIIIK